MAISRKTIQLDATNLWCPDFSLPVRRFLSEIEDHDYAHIVTKEPRAEARIEHICVTYSWFWKVQNCDGLFHFIISKVSF